MTSCTTVVGDPGHLNRGEDVIAEAGARMMDISFDPTSAVGVDLVGNFWPKPRDRSIGVARAAIRHARRGVPLGTDADGELVPS